MLNIVNKNLPKIYSSFETSKIEEEFADSYYNNLCIIDTDIDSNFLAPEGITGLKVNAIEAYSKNDLLKYCLPNKENKTKEFIEGLYSPSENIEENNKIGKVYWVRLNPFSPAYIDNDEKVYSDNEITYKGNLVNQFETYLTSLAFNKDNDYNSIFKLAFRKDSFKKIVYLESQFIYNNTIFWSYKSKEGKSWKEVFESLNQDVKFLEYFKKIIIEDWEFSDNIAFNKDINEIYYFKGSSIQDIDFHNSEVLKTYLNSIGVAGIVWTEEPSIEFAYSLRLNNALVEHCFNIFFLDTEDDNLDLIEDYFGDLDNILFLYNDCTSDYNVDSLMGKMVGRIFSQNPSIPCTYKDINTKNIELEISEDELEDFSKKGIITTYWDKDLQKFCLSKCVTTYQSDEIISNAKTHSLQVKRILFQVQKLLTVSAKREFFNENVATKAELSISYLKKWVANILNSFVCSSKNNSYNYLLDYKINNIEILEDCIKVYLSLKVNSEISRFFAIVTTLK